MCCWGNSGGFVYIVHWNGKKPAADIRNKVTGDDAVTAGGAQKLGVNDVDNVLIC